MLQKIRYSIGQCERCGRKTSDLNCHYLNRTRPPTRSMNPHSPGNIVVLCHKCHHMAYSMGLVRRELKQIICLRSTENKKKLAGLLEKPEKRADTQPACSTPGTSTSPFFRHPSLLGTIEFGGTFREILEEFERQERQVRVTPGHQGQRPDER